jgi:hypothetical protein
MTNTDRSKPVNYKNPAQPLISWHAAPSMGPLGSEVERARCTARSKRSGERCKCWPMKGRKVCGIHGGAAGQVRAAAQRRLQAQAVAAEVEGALAYESVVGVTNPLEALSLLAGEALMLKEAFAARVNALKSLSYSAVGSGTEQLRAEVALYERALDRSAKFLDLLAKSDFEAQRIALSQAQGAMLAKILDRIFDGLELSGAQRLLIPEVVPAAIRAITAGSHRG